MVLHSLAMGTVTTVTTSALGERQLNENIFKTNKHFFF